MKIGIMGGTFDPIHNGHLMLGEYAYRQFKLDKIWFMPNGCPPHKNNAKIGSEALTRAIMVELAIREKDYFRLEDYEIRKDTVSYSYDTLEHFNKLYPEHSFYFIIGADSLFSIERWVNPGRVLGACTILAAYRDDKNDKNVMQEQIYMLNQKYNADIRLLETPVMDVSSSDLREMIHDNLDVSAYLPKEVENYIKEHRLYHI